jgi:hypothetical protein
VKQKRLSREKRLKCANGWIVTYRGRNLVREYKKRYGVTDVCAVLELRMLGADIPDARLEQARRDEQLRAAHNARRKQKRARLADHGDSDETFAFIAGHTEGGAPYGITWEEMSRRGDAGTEGGAPDDVPWEEVGPHDGAETEDGASYDIPWEEMGPGDDAEDEDLPF